MILRLSSFSDGFSRTSRTVYFCSHHVSSIPLCHLFQVVDMLAPYQRGGKIGLFGGAGVGKTVLIMELINNIAKAHGMSLFPVPDMEQVPWSSFACIWSECCTCRTCTCQYCSMISPCAVCTFCHFLNFVSILPWFCEYKLAACGGFLWLLQTSVKAHFSSGNFF